MRLWRWRRIPRIPTPCIWARINSGLASLNHPYIAIDPNIENRLYASVYVSGSGYQSYLSTDGGASWEALSLENPLNNLSHLTVSPQDSQTIIGFTYGKVFTTTTGGDRWAEALDFSSTGVIFNNIEYSSDRSMVYASSDQLQVYISTDGGATFNNAESDIQELIGH